VQLFTSFVLLQCGKIKISLYPYENEMIEIVTGNVNPPQGWYSEFFGSVYPNPVIILKKNSEPHKTTKIGYWISFVENDTTYPKGLIQQWVENIEKKIINNKSKL
jgi:hypothetical protein